jgi:hypothetical protein
VTRVYLEVGTRKVFACALDWPGWCRAGKGEEAALGALASCAPRYAAVAARAGIAFDAEREAADFEVLERMKGSATTDFGALDAVPEIDGLPGADDRSARTVALVRAAWYSLDAAAASAPQALRKGPRGGGRDRDAVVQHVLETEVLHARMLGIKKTGQARADVLQEIEAGVSRMVPFVARRTAWHSLDHAWEIEDRSGGPSG